MRSTIEAQSVNCEILVQKIDVYGDGERNLIDILIDVKDTRFRIIVTEAVSNFIEQIRKSRSLARF
jgi:hypothetical protein